MEVDTGAALYYFTGGTFPEIVLQQSSVFLRTYTGEVLPVVGEMPACVRYGNQTIIDEEAPSLFERDSMVGTNPIGLERNWCCEQSEITRQSAEDQ